MANGIVAGDTVQLRSGGPEMTVLEVDSFNGIASAVCIWFDGKKETRSVIALVGLNKTN